jgi:hypothetical protein
MNTLGFRHHTVSVALAAGIALAGLAATANADTTVRLPLDTDTSVNGVDVACTGIGQSRDNPRWRDYPVRLEFSDAKGEYVSDETLKLSRAGGGPMLSVSCQAPWVLMKLPAGHDYRVRAALDEAGTSQRLAAVRVPEHGQARVSIVFPHAD